MLPRADAVQLSRLLRSRRIGSRSARPNAPSRLAVLFGRTLLTGASRLGRPLGSATQKHVNGSQKRSTGVLLHSYDSRTTRETRQWHAGHSYLEAKTVKLSLSCDHRYFRVVLLFGATAGLMQAHHCSCPWDRHTLR